MQPTWPLFQSQVAEVLDPGGSPLLSYPSKKSAGYDQTVFLTVVRCVLFHKTNVAYVNIGLITEVYIQYITFGFSLDVFGIAQRHCQ
jgi:hypothetical protein